MSASFRSLNLALHLIHTTFFNKAAQHLARLPLQFLQATNFAFKVHGKN